MIEKLDKPYKIEKDHAYLGLQLIYCRPKADSEKIGLVNEAGFTRCRLCQKLLQLRKNLTGKEA